MEGVRFLVITRKGISYVWSWTEHIYWGHEDISWISSFLSLNVWYMITSFIYLINRIQRMYLSYFSLESDCCFGARWRKMLFYVSKSFPICCHYCHIKLLYNYLIISEFIRSVKSDSKLKFKYYCCPIKPLYTAISSLNPAEIGMISSNFKFQAPH